jgi:hypothetical protein
MYGWIKRPDGGNADKESIDAWLLGPSIVDKTRSEASFIPALPSCAPVKYICIAPPTPTGQSHLWYRAADVSGTDGKLKVVERSSLCSILSR